MFEFFGKNALRELLIKIKSLKVSTFENDAGYITSEDIPEGISDADTLDGKKVSDDGTAGIPVINSDYGVMEIGRYIDFHTEAGQDYKARLWVGDDGKLYGPFSRSDSAGSADYAAQAHDLRTFSSNGGSHGDSYRLYSKHNVLGDDRFYIGVTDGYDRKVAVNYAEGAGSANKVWTTSHPGEWYLDSSWDGYNFVTRAKNVTSGDILNVWVNSCYWADVLDGKHATDFVSNMTHLAGNTDILAYAVNNAPLGFSVYRVYAATNSPQGTGVDCDHYYTIYKLSPEWIIIKATDVRSHMEWYINRNNGNWQGWNAGTSSWAFYAANNDPGSYTLKNIAACTGDLVAGTTALSTGHIYISCMNNIMVNIIKKEIYRCLNSLVRTLYVSY